MDNVGGLSEPEARGPGSETSPLSLPAGLCLHFHAAPATLHQSGMRSWGWAAVQQAFLEFCKKKV